MTEPLSASQSAELRRMDLAHHLPAQSDYQLRERLGGSRIIVRADGCTIEDADGNRLLDGMAGLWCVNVGYGRKELAQAAYEQMLQLPFYNTFFKTANEPAIRLAAEIVGAARRRSDARVFQQFRLRIERHGVPAGAPLLGAARRAEAPDFHQPLERVSRLDGGRREPRRHETDACARRNLPIPGIEHVMQPYWFGDGYGEDAESFGARAAAAIEARILEVGAENVAAFIGEPVQGAGGVIIPPPGLLEESRSRSAANTASC